MRHVLRILFLTLALVLLGLALAPRAVPAQAVGPCDPDRPVTHWWALRPGEPCDGDSVTLVFGSCGNCVDLVGYEWADRDTGVLHLDVAMPARCPVTEECVLDTLDVPLGRLAAGSHTLLYDLHVSVAAGDSTPACDFVQHASLRFTIGCPAPPGPACDSLPYVDVVEIGPPVDCGCNRSRRWPELRPGVTRMGCATTAQSGKLIAFGRCRRSLLLWVFGPVGSEPSNPLAKRFSG